MKLFITLLLALITPVAINAETIIEETFTYDSGYVECLTENDYYEKYVWYNTGIATMSVDGENQIDFFDRFEINEVEALNSSAVYVQSEVAYYDEFVVEAPEGYGFNSVGELGFNTNEEFKSSTFEHPDGYIEFITKAYQIGMYDGGIVYHIEVDAIYLSSFFIQKKDNLVIQHGNNAVTYDGFSPEGYITKRYTSYDYLGNATTYTYTEDAVIDTTAGNGGGVSYEVDILAPGSMDLMIFIDNEKVTGHHYIVATDTTQVLASYVHNYSVWFPSLSLQFGPVGVGIDSNAPNTDVMSGQAMTLPGYADRIQTNVITLSPADYGFEQQYFFYEKTYSHSIDSLEFDTTRLRCGYIEEEYINLSSNRQGAGDAYLVYNFNNPIYEFNVDLAYWSNSERFTDTTGYLQYKNSNGEWITLLDLMDSNNGIPTDRTNPKNFNFYIIEGTYEIRFITHTNNPTADRNKGRVCIGDITFVSYDID